MSDSPLGSLIGAGISGLTGNPIGAVASLVGLGASLFGGAGQAGVAKEEAGISAANAGLERDVNDQRRQAMVLTARRQQMENFRNTQRARAQGLNAAVNQGASMGSGLQGGQAQAADMGMTNSVGINQNLGIGENIFNLDNQISGNKIKLASLGGLSATYQGVSSLGGSLSKAAGPLGSMFPGGSSSSSSGDYSGNPWSQNTGNLF